MPEFNKILHYCWFSETPFRFPLPFYVCIASALRHLRPHQAILWSDNPPFGIYWERIKDQIEVREVETDVRSWDGKPILKLAHKSDKVRLDVLYRYGGIYLDFDALVLKPFDDLFGGTLVMGAEEEGGLGNGVMLCRQNDDFIRIWMKHYPRRFEPRGWNEASVFLPRFLSEVHEDLIRVLPSTAFYDPPWYQSRRIFNESDVLKPESYSCHLWASTCFDVLEGISNATVRTGSSQFDQIARQYL